MMQNNHKTMQNDLKIMLNDHNVASFAAEHLVGLL